MSFKRSLWVWFSIVGFAICSYVWSTPTRHFPFAASWSDGGQGWERVAVYDSLIGTSFAVLEANGLWQRFGPQDTTVLLYRNEAAGAAPSGTTVIAVTGTARYDSSRVISMDTLANNVTEPAKFLIRKSGLFARDSVFASVEHIYRLSTDSAVVNAKQGNDSNKVIDEIPTMKYAAGAAVVEAGSKSEVYLDRIEVGSHDPNIADSVQFEARLYPNQLDSLRWQTVGRAEVVAKLNIDPKIIPLGIHLTEGGRLEVWARAASASSFGWAIIHYRRLK